MAVTVKKKKLTVKSKMAESGADAAEGAAAPSVAAPVATAQASAKGPSYTWAAMLGLVAVLVCITLLIFQWLEWSFYHQPPTAFPIQVQPM